MSVKLSAAFFAGVILGALLMFAASNRYEAMTFQNFPGRLDKLTGRACLYSQDTTRNRAAVFELYGVELCR